MTKKHIISHKTLLDYYGREKMRKNSLIGRIEEINLLESICFSYGYTETPEE